MSWSDPDDSTAENLQAWQRFSEAWAKRDIDGLMALVTDDIVCGRLSSCRPGASSTRSAPCPEFASPPAPGESTYEVV